VKPPLCFVLMPFGKKPTADGSVIDFDQVYSDLIAPAIQLAQLEPLRADQETSGGIIHKPMFERLILCPFAIADLTTANANVYYELGVRHAFRPWSTVQIIADGSRLPFDVQMLRTISYKLTANGTPDPAGVEAAKSTITKFLQQAREGAKDSPIFQLLDGLPVPSLEHLKTDVFREQVEYSEEIKGRLAAAGKTGAPAVQAVASDLGDISELDSGIAVDLLLSYRAASAWEDMVALVKEKISRPLADTVLAREQLGFALNRLQRRDDAEAVLLNLIEERGSSSETCGLLGRVYKDQWEDAVKTGKQILAAGYLEKAIDMYLRGFEADWRDAYPGVNAVTLMELQDPPDDRRLQLLPVVRYGVQRKVAKGQPDYWDYAALVELAVLENDRAAALQALSRALPCIREKWEPETTVRNLRLIREKREARGTASSWAKEIEDELDGRAA
jgi:tetratricopeptide (TPR) repeat protein